MQDTKITPPKSKERRFESKIPTISKRTKSAREPKPDAIKPAKMQKPAGKATVKQDKKLTFQEPHSRSEQRGQRRGFKTLKETHVDNSQALRPAGIPSIRNRWDAEWMRLTRHDRPQSMPTRINRFTYKASHEWRDGDNSAFEVDRARIKRQGTSNSSHSQRNTVAAIYPDWWGDASYKNSRSANKSRSRYDDDDVDDFDRKVTFKEKKSRVLKQLPQTNIRRYRGHPSDETSPAEDYNEPEEDSQAEEMPAPKSKPKSKPKKVEFSPNPEVSTNTEKGTIYSKLRDQNKERPQKKQYSRMKLASTHNEQVVGTKQTRNGFAMTYSPTSKKKKSKENVQQNETHYQYMEQPHDYERIRDEKQRTYVRQCDQYNMKHSKVYKGKPMKERRENDAKRANQTREAIYNAREAHNFSRTQHTNRRKIPKSLKHVESVIKKRVDLDREIGKKRRQNNQNFEVEAEIYVPAKKQPKSRKTRKSRSNSQERVNREEFESLDTSMKQQPQEEQYVEQTLNQQYTGRQNQTEGSSYPSVTQASAPPPEYFEKQQNQSE